MTFQAETTNQTTKPTGFQVPKFLLQDLRVWYIQLSCSSAGYALCVLRLFMRAGSVVLRGAAA